MMWVPGSNDAVEKLARPVGWSSVRLAMADPSTLNLTVPVGSAAGLVLGGARSRGR